MQDQPQVLILALVILELDFQFQLALLVEHGLQQRGANAVVVQWPAFDQQLPGLRAGLDTEQVLGYLVDFGDAQLLEQLAAMFRVIA